MMRLFYFADGYNRRADARTDSRRIQAGTKGWVCNAQWLLGGLDNLPPETCARADMGDIRNASAVIIGPGPSTQGGKWVELGLAIALEKPVCMIFPPGFPAAGAPPPVFAYPREHTVWVAGIESAMQWLDNLS